jgi:hypothetical protein
MLALKSIILAGVLAVPAAQSAANAAEIVGAEAELEYSSFPNDLDDIDKLTARGALEIGFTPAFSLQADLNISKFGFVDQVAPSAGLHAIYHLSSASLGVFYAKDWLDETHANSYGVEIANDFGPFSTEAYIGQIDDGFNEATILGLRGDVSVMENLTIGARYDLIDYDTFKFYRLSLTTGYDFGNFELTGEIGRGDLDVLGQDSLSGDETFVSIGLKIHFGARRGATFDHRGFLAIIPGL